ncbi:MAG: cytochrome P450 [Alphaproteobacteria bacterium]|nr:cytochrome P450 [Alphaproteobacteria bacterium]
MGQIKSEPFAVATLVPETVRFQSSIIHMCRTATKDAILAGQQIRKGDKVIMWHVSGNRDDAVIDNPDSFIIDRLKPHQNLSHGAGIHRCAGDRLANLKLETLWVEVLKRGWETGVQGEPVRVTSNFIRCIKSPPV